MLIIYNKKTKVFNNHGTNSAFPCGNIPNLELGLNEVAVRVNDNSEIAQQILSAHSYEFTIKEVIEKETIQVPIEGNEEEFEELEVIKDTYYTIDALTITKTLEEFRQEQDKDPVFLLPKIREERNKLLTESDWTQLPDSPLTPEKRQEWVLYRQQLRDITTQDINNIVFPTKPE